MIKALFGEQELSATDADIIASSFTNPSVRKYLTNLANTTIIDIIHGEPLINETAESYLRRQATVKGRLEVLNTLLSIQTAQAVSR